MNVLILDDEILNIIILKKYFEYFFKDKHTVTGYQEADKALEHFENNKIDLLILDYFMPDICGDAFLKLLKKKIEKLPIVIVQTADTSLTLKEMDFFTAMYKPITKEKFRQNLELVEKRLESENQKRLCQ